MIEFEGERIQGTNFVVPTRDPKDIVADLPPGLIGNPMAVPRCALVDFTRGGDCPVSSQVGVAEVAFATSVLIEPIYDLVPEKGQSAEFGTPTGQPFNVVATRSVAAANDNGNHW